MRPALSLLDAPAVMRLPEGCTVSTVNNGVVLSAPVPVPVPVPALVPEPVRVSGVSSESLGRVQRGEMVGRRLRVQWLAAYRRAPATLLECLG
jgi:hypothetical protein